MPKADIVMQYSNFKPLISKTNYFNFEALRYLVLYLGNMGQHLRN